MNDVSGKIGSAIQPNITDTATTCNGYLTILSNPTISPDSTLALCFWIYSSSNSFDYERIIVQKEGAFTFKFLQSPSTEWPPRIIFEADSGSNTNDFFVKNQWIHYCAIAWNNYLDMYVNGGKVSSSTGNSYSGLFQENGLEINIAGRKDDFSFPGKIDEMGLWKSIQFNNEEEVQTFVSSLYNDGQGVSYETIRDSPDPNLNSCSWLYSPNTNYHLTSDVYYMPQLDPGSGEITSCFEVYASNISLDCHGKKIIVEENFYESLYETYPIRSFQSYNNVEFKNCYFEAIDRFGEPYEINMRIALFGDNQKVMNNFGNNTFVEYRNGKNSLFSNNSFGSVSLYSVNDSIFENNNSGILRNTAPLNTPDNYFVRVFVEDINGNVGNTTFYINITSSTLSNPNILIISPISRSYGDDVYLVNISLNEAGSCMYSLNGGLNNKSLSSLDNLNFYATESGVANGNYVLTAYCTDFDGNTNHASVSFTISISSGDDPGDDLGGPSGGGPTGPSCADSCFSLGFSCGQHVICSNNINCGNCSDGFRCEIGQCIFNCVENWNCSDWSNCVNGEKTRVCSDLNNCGTSSQIPPFNVGCETETPGLNNSVVKIIILTLLILMGGGLILGGVFFLLSKKSLIFKKINNSSLDSINLINHILDQGEYYLSSGQLENAESSYEKIRELFDKLVPEEQSKIRDKILEFYSRLNSIPK